jgi:hypothetical protein
MICIRDYMTRNPSVVSVEIKGVSIAKEAREGFLNPPF